MSSYNVDFCKNIGGNVGVPTVTTEADEKYFVNCTPTLQQ
jgi:hypothetical protein